MYVDLNLRVLYDINGQWSLPTKPNRCRLYNIIFMSPIIIDLNVFCAPKISYGLIKCLIKVVQQRSTILGI